MNIENMNEDELPEDIRELKGSVTMIAILAASTIISLLFLVVFAWNVSSEIEAIMKAGGAL